MGRDDPAEGVACNPKRCCPTSLPHGGLDRGLPGPVCVPVRAVQRQGDRPGQQRQLGDAGRPEDGSLGTDR